MPLFGSAARRAALMAVGVGLLALTVLVAVAVSDLADKASGHAGGVRPNIVFVLTDDLSNNLVPYMPHVVALEREGVSFGNYFVVDSLCCPSRSAIFTGQYPHDDGVFTNTGSDGGYRAYNRFGDPAKTFAVGLHNAGYYTGFMGKYLNGYLIHDPRPPGWDQWAATDNGYHEFDYPLNVDGTVRRYGHAPRDYLTDVLAAKASGFITAARSTGKPFALEVATFAPHFPSIPAPVDRGTFTGVQAPRGPAFNRRATGGPPWLQSKVPLSGHDRKEIDDQFRLRIESVQAVDRMIGQIEQTLATTHQLANTYFVFSSDNGYHMGEYRMMPGKQTPFDTDIRVPLVVAGPGVPAGGRIDQLASSIDLAPTFLQIANARATDVPDGVSLLNLLHGRSAPRTWQRAVLIEHHGPTTNRNDPDSQRPSAGDPPSYQAMRTATYLYVEYVTGQRQYINLSTDPFELRNLASTLPAQRLVQLHRQLRSLTNCHGASACQLAARLPRPH